MRCIWESGRKGINMALGGFGKKIIGMRVSFLTMYLMALELNKIERPIKFHRLNLGWVPKLTEMIERSFLYKYSLSLYAHSIL